jgi:hypothetical protein
VATSKLTNRPVGITFLGITVIIVALSNGLRLCETVFFWKVLGKYHASPIYLALTGAFWLFIGFILVFEILRRKSWAWAGTIAGISCYAAWYWVDRLEIEIPHANGPFALVLTILFLGISTMILFSKNTRRYFHLLNAIK